MMKLGQKVNLPEGTVDLADALKNTRETTPGTFALVRTDRPDTDRIFLATENGHELSHVFVEANTPDKSKANWALIKISDRTLDEREAAEEAHRYSGSQTAAQHAGSGR